MSQAPTTLRFSNRVDDYARYRPGYPSGVARTLESEAGLRPGSVVADVGSGTGISSAIFLEIGCIVFGVEPNAGMRHAAEEAFKSRPNFKSIDGTAEATTLPDGIADLVVAAQAFHWFDREAARAEFSRILKPGGFVALLWNERDTTSTPFSRDYEALLHRFGTDYREVDHRRIGEDIIADFFRGRLETRRFENEQVLDFSGLKGRLLSSSYVPSEGHPDYDAMIRELERLYESRRSNKNVRIVYNTVLYFGHLSSTAP